MTTETMRDVIPELAARAARDQDDQDAAYLRLVCAVGAGAERDPDTIHAALRQLGRTHHNLELDLAGYRAVRDEFEVFAQLGDREQQAADADHQHLAAVQQVTRAQVALRAAERAVADADRHANMCRRQAERAHDALTAARVAGERLMADPARLRFVPDGVRDRMARVNQLAEATRAAERTWRQTQERVGELRAQSADHEREVAYLRTRDWFAVVPSLDRDDAVARQKHDRQRIGNLESTIDQNVRLVAQLEEQLLIEQDQHHRLTDELANAWGRLARALRRQTT